MRLYVFRIVLFTSVIWHNIRDILLKFCWKHVLLVKCDCLTKNVPSLQLTAPRALQKLLFLLSVGFKFSVIWRKHVKQKETGVFTLFSPIPFFLLCLFWKRCFLWHTGSYFTSRQTCDPISTQALYPWFFTKCCCSTEVDKSPIRNKCAKDVLRVKQKIACSHL